MHRKIHVVVGIIAVTAVAASPAIGAPNGKGSPQQKGTGSFIEAEVVQPPAVNTSSVILTDRAADSRNGGEDYLWFSHGSGYSIEHEALPEGRVNCDTSSSGQAFDRRDGRATSWIEDLRANGSTVVDGGFVCFAGWGKDFSRYTLRYWAAGSAGTEPCLRISLDENGTYTVATGPYSPERTETTTYPGDPGLPVVGGGTPDRTETTTYPAEGCEGRLFHRAKPADADSLIAEEISAPFTYTFTLGS